MMAVRNLRRAAVGAARVDGCGPFRSFLQIMLPLARPAVAVLAVFTLISYWGSFLWPPDRGQRRRVEGHRAARRRAVRRPAGTQWNLMMAASMLAMVPTALLVILLQMHLVRGLLVTGLGGR
jgi:multiple sugar transport system permease protein